MTKEQRVKEAIELFVEEGYIVSLKGKYNLTGSFHRNYVPLPSTGLVVSKKNESTDVAVSSSMLTGDEMFMQYIKAAEIPTRTSNGRGGFYWINRFHKDAAKEFARLISKENINIQVLTASTKLYYLQTKECANTIANYIVLGIWRSGYQDMLDSMNRGTIKEDIQKQLSDNNTSNVEAI